MTQAQVVRHINLNTLTQRLESTERVPLKKCYVGIKVRYHNKFWNLTQIRHLGKGWFQILLERGIGKTAEQQGCRMKQDMTLEIKRGQL